MEEYKTKTTGQPRYELTVVNPGGSRTAMCSYDLTGLIHRVQQEQNIWDELFPDDELVQDRRKTVMQQQENYEQEIKGML